eukprot:Skav207115  [mRNA]  locus=scaffold156:236119:238705:- [translate_table: standard]
MAILTSLPAATRHLPQRSDSSGGQDSGKLQWACEELKEEGFLEMVQKTDQELSSKGYKTIAAWPKRGHQCARMIGGRFSVEACDDLVASAAEFLHHGILHYHWHRHWTVFQLQTDEICDLSGSMPAVWRMVGMATNILPGEATREGGHTGDETIREAGGFAQVLPRDKRECVLALQRSYELVVGMTGALELGAGPGGIQGWLRA